VTFEPHFGVLFAVVAMLLTVIVELLPQNTKFFRIFFIQQIIVYIYLQHPNFLSPHG
jgi:hypothetical protein